MSFWNIWKIMAIKAILTNRELKNKLTGIDLYVSDYQEIPHKIRNSFLYHVIVVSNLFYYKSAQHKQSDVVQFMVSKSFEEFEELYQKLYKRFPSVNFPSLPSKKTVSSKVDERLRCMDKVMKLVACTQKLASSTMVISFLKGDSKKPQQQTTPDEKDALNSKGIEKENISDRFIDNDANVPSVDTGGDLVKQSTNEDNLFEVNLSADDDDINELTDDKDGLSNAGGKGGSSLFDDDTNQDEDDLFTMTSPNEAAASRKSAFQKDYALEIDDEKDILDVSDDLDDLLLLSKSSEKHSAIKAQKPAAPPRHKSGSVDVSELAGEEEKDGIFQRTKSQTKKKERNDSSNLEDIFSKNKKKGLFDDEDDDDLFTPSSPTKPESSTTDVESMGQEDIMNYIQSNE